MTKEKIFLMTGGHITPALAVIDELNDKNIPVKIVFIGRKYVNESEDAFSFEYQELKKRNVIFINLQTGRLTRLLTFKTVINFFKVPYGFISSWRILKRVRPDLVLSFGGYLAFPMACVAYLKNIPVYTHEQTIHPGLANRLIGRISKLIFVSFPESIKYFPAKRTICTGNPIRKSIFFTKKPNLVNKEDLPVIYITGGSLGAHAVNALVENIISKLLARAIVIHQTGNVKEYGDYERLMRLRDMLPHEVQKHYIIKQHFSDDEIGSIYKASDIIVGRSGANTFLEAIALGKPAVFIPLPYSAGGEQREHAWIFKNYKAGEIFEQSEDSSLLCKYILHVLKHLDEYKTRVKSLSHYYHPDAAIQIINYILKN